MLRTRRNLRVFPVPVCIPKRFNHPLSGIFATPAMPIVPATGNPPQRFKPKQEESPVSEAVVRTAETRGCFLYRYVSRKDLNTGYLLFLQRPRFQ
eukprot:scaffold398135_cov55-Attheya_sp.AAC.2